MELRDQERRKQKAAATAPPIVVLDSDSDVASVGDNLVRVAA